MVVEISDTGADPTFFHARGGSWPLAILQNSSVNPPTISFYGFLALGSAYNCPWIFFLKVEIGKHFPSNTGLKKSRIK